MIEPYYSGSHRAWVDGFVASSRHEIEPLTLPGRFWKWRMFGGTLTLAHDARDRPRPDVILASDMLNLPSFLGHVNWGDVPTVLYMHENQLTYPLSPTARDDLAYAYMNWSSMVRADEVWFNSQFHLDSVFDALPGFLRHFPDARHTGMVEDVFEKCSVVPVGVDLDWIKSRDKSHPPLIVWNQRWEHDKDPVRLFHAFYRLADSGADFRLAICGENFRNVPEEFNEAKGRLADQLIHFGFAERHRYEELLLDASIVVSTAKHEFFGIAAVEAIAAGAAPVVPNDLSYPELVPKKIHADSLYETDEELDSLLVHLVTDSDLRRSVSKVVMSSMGRFSWDKVAVVYDRRLSKLS